MLAGDILTNEEKNGQLFLRFSYSFNDQAKLPAHRHGLKNHAGYMRVSLSALFGPQWDAYKPRPNY